MKAIPAARAGLCELSVLREKPIAGMDCVHIVGDGRGDDFIDPQVTFRRWRSAEISRLIAPLDRQRSPVGIGVDGDACNPGFAKPADDSYRDLAPVGDQNSTEHIPRRLSQSPFAHIRVEKCVDCKMQEGNDLKGLLNYRGPETEWLF